jgi:hypothetical protein
MKKTIILCLLGLSLVSCKSSKAGCDAYSNTEATDSSLAKGLDVLSDSASNWTSEQKKEFADVFFIERGKFSIPEKPIKLETFGGN